MTTALAPNFRNLAVAEILGDARRAPSPRDDLADELAAMLERCALGGGDALLARLARAGTRAKAVARRLERGGGGRTGAAEQLIVARPGRKCSGARVRGRSPEGWPTHASAFLGMAGARCVVYRRAIVRRCAWR